MGAAPEGKGVNQLDEWSEKDQQRVTVREGGGFLYNLQLQSKIDSSPDEVYNVLTDPTCTNVFRNIKECIYRRVVEDNGKGKRKLEIGHKAQAKFLWINFIFETHLHVWEDSAARTIRFKVAKEGGAMKKFEGCWNIGAFAPSDMDRIRPAGVAKLQLTSVSPAALPTSAAAMSAAAAAAGSSSSLPAASLPLSGGDWLKPALLLSRFQKGSGSQSLLSPRESFVTLEQNIHPSGPVPIGVKGLIRGLCAKQCKNLLEDLRTELQKRKGVSNDADKGQGGGSAGPALLIAQKAAAPAACMSLASDQLPLLWSWITPINITIVM